METPLNLLYLNFFVVLLDYMIKNCTPPLSTNEIIIKILDGHVIYRDT